MRHGGGLRKFSRATGHRNSLFRNLATSLLEHERLETTLPKAKDLRRIVERLITLGREDTLPHRRRAYGYLTSKSVVHKLFAEIGPRFTDRPGGYTRIVRTRVRPGDGAQMAVIALLEDETKSKSAAKGGAKASAKKTPGKPKAKAK